ncbi:sensor histidine kinase [Sulfitobacter sp. G21635-S1]|uniref:sensor histidine kinase n=1 Tax=Sulfitobacter sp. G21635-S1 TaxID=3014043 RepID=UPI0022AF041F|nr:sensor histidine kinase [Sulfitobacter sp. G21635-S1]MCZ4255227.1 sensor histidine kinase [Sulfitobacter sp. G21635-S1]
MRPHSLRSRLILIILTPLLLIALITGIWQYRTTTLRAEGIFDRGLLSAALAISRDIAVSDGDALSPPTRAILSDTSGGEIFYHVYAPDGVFVTGYATPPVQPPSAPQNQAEPYYYDARYRGEEVRVLRFQDGTTISGVSGVFNITVWQNADVRNNFVHEVVTRSFAVIGLLVASVALVVWFGVALGLRPLLDLEMAIARRTPTDLEPIRRPVPIEARKLVETLNTLLDRVSRRISSKDEFISNAAHQLRNPVAGVLALAEAVQNAPSRESAIARSAELVDAAREASSLTNQLLSFERASGTDVDRSGTRIDLRDLLSQITERFKSQIAPRQLDLTLALPDRAVVIKGDEFMLQEAFLNLLMNAVVHGGPGMSAIAVNLAREGEMAVIEVKDNGVGIPREKFVEAVSRFGQANGGPGSGLGLPIAARVMENHGGSLRLLDISEGGAVLLALPLDEGDLPHDSRRKSN